MKGEGSMNWKERVYADPLICHGQVCIKGTRVPVAVILDNLSEGVTEAEVLRSYPTLTSEDIKAALGYAAELSRERIISISA